MKGTKIGCAAYSPEHVAVPMGTQLQLLFDAVKYVGCNWELNPGGLATTQP